MHRYIIDPLFDSTGFINIQGKKTKFTSMLILYRLLLVINPQNV